MDTQTFIQTVVYPALASVIGAAAFAAVMYIRSIAATWQQVADSGKLERVLLRGQALAEQAGLRPEDVPAKVADYLHTTEPALAQRTGMAVVASDGSRLVPTVKGVQRIDATIAVAKSTDKPAESLQ